jgi:hypothetical protein
MTAALNIATSPTWYETYATARSMNSAHIDASPLNPSMMLMAFERPVTASTVKPTAAGYHWISVSRPGMSVRMMTASSSQIPRPDEPAMNQSLQRGATLRARSSARPERKAGMAVSNRSHNVGVIGILNASAHTMPISNPMKMPTPPTRGTGRAWNFCGPVRLRSAEILACAFAERTTSRLTMQDVRKLSMKNCMGSRRRSASIIRAESAVPWNPAHVRR